MSDELFFFLRERFEYPPKWCTYSAVWLLHGWCHVKLLPSRRVLCTPCNHAPCRVSFVGKERKWSRFNAGNLPTDIKDKVLRGSSLKISWTKESAYSSRNNNNKTTKEDKSLSQLYEQECINTFGVKFLSRWFWNTNVLRFILFQTAAQLQLKNCTRRSL